MTQQSEKYFMNSDECRFEMKLCLKRNRNCKSLKKKHLRKTKEATMKLSIIIQDSRDMKGQELNLPRTLINIKVERV